MTGRELKAVRTRLGMTQQDFAVALGRRYFYEISRFEHETRPIPPDTAALVELLDSEPPAKKGRKK